MYCTTWSLFTQQANALLNWEKRMEDRSHLQDKIARESRIGADTH